MEKVAVSNNRKVKWLKKLGIWGFLFFLVKGIIWLIIAIGGYLLAS